MKKIRSITRRHLFGLLALAMVAAMLAGCTPTDPGTTTAPPTTTAPSSSGTTTTAPAGTEPEAQGEKIYRYADQQDVTNLSPHMSLAASDGGVVNWTTSTFYRWLPQLDRTGSELLPDMAIEDPIDVDGSGKIWNIKLRQNLTWDNGDPIDANTFIYSYQRALDPTLANSTVMDLISNAIIIKNAEAYYTQLDEGNPAVAWEEVGIRLVDNYTIQIETETKCKAFDVMRHFAGSRATCPIYEPLYEGLMNADKTSTSYGTDLDKLISAGPFKIISWTKGSERILAKNPDWVYADRIKIDKVHVRIIEDANTRLQLFENGEADYIGLNQQTYEIYKEDPRVRLALSTEVISFDINAANTEKPILADKDFRQALYYGLDRQTAGDLSTHMPYERYLNMLATGDPEAGIGFWDKPEAQATIKPNLGYNPELAKELFERAMTNNGYGPNDKLTLNMIYSETSSLWKLLAEFCQAEYAELFGENRFEITLTAMPYAQAMEQIKTWKENPNAFELAWCGWVHGGVLYNPCIQFMFFSEDYFNLNSPPPTSTVSDLYAQSLLEENKLDSAKLFALAVEMEKAMIEDVYVVPVVNVVSKYMYSERMILALDEYDAMVGWAPWYSDIDLSK